MTISATPTRIVPNRDASLTVTTSGYWEVELFGPVEMPDGSQRIAHCYRRFTPSVEVASAAIRSWLTGDLVPVGFEAVE